MMMKNVKRKSQLFFCCFESAIGKKDERESKFRNNMKE